jgi:acyl-CoA synthetase (AMP-forming)/AMP-acid ligase II
VDTSTVDRAVPFAMDLPRHGGRAALVTEAGEVSYRDLAARVATARSQLGGGRRLVMVAATSSVDAVVTYLAALAGGHPVLLVRGDAGAAGDLLARYDPDVIASEDARGRWRIEPRRDGTVHDPHLDLALLLSTSGTTGSPRLVRLSHQNLQSNAEAIAEYLGIGADDRGATTLPLSYCYGLSVINSHLVRGASVFLTERSVADPRFWRMFRRRRCTGLAGVPYTFDLLDRVGFAGMRLPHLRRVTQAGGRLAPDRVAAYAALGRRAGWSFFVMYGQTEATARMAYLPPDLAESHPDAIGRPIPGGSFRLDPVAEWTEPDTGEIVYTGPNVMLGYADDPADLALGRTVEELRTGDIARHGDDGLYRLVGRRSRFAKILGLRVDPQRAEDLLATHAIDATCVGSDDELIVAVRSGPDPATVRRLVADAFGLPTRSIRVHEVADLPRLANGKPDYEALRALTSLPIPAQAPAPSGLTSAATEERSEEGRRYLEAPGPARAKRAQSSTERAPGSTDLRRVYADVLERPDVTEDDSFVDLGGDSLSYVELSVRLEQVLGHLPADWPSRPIRDLRPRPATGSRGRRWLRRVKATVDMGVALRAVAIVLIVGTHAQWFAIAGGAHLLLAAAGFNLARFHLTDSPRAERVRGILRVLRRVAVVSVVWIGLLYLVTDDYALRHVFLLNYLIGPVGVHNHYWFIEALVYVVLGLCALLAIPAVDRLERRYPFALPMGVAALGLVTRYQLVPGVQWRTPALVVWLVALGWAAARATTVWRRLVVTAAVALTVPGFFNSGPREALVAAGVILLVWLPRLAVPRPLNWLAGVLAGASLYIYLTHWQVFPLLDQVSGGLATVASLAAGVAVAALLRVGRRLPRPAFLAGRPRTRLSRYREM